jgi:tetratricopeptide (TPR) repeat protein
MTPSQKKLFQFAVIFGILAVALFFYMGGPNQPEIPQPATSTMADERIMQMRQELETFKVSLKENPNNLDVITRIGNLYYDLNQPDSSVKYYEKALEINPDNPNVLTDCAVMYYRIGDNRKALAYLDRAIEIKPDLGQAWFNKGFILMAGMDKHQEAIEAWRKFIEISPESEQAKFIKSQIEAIESGEIE